LVLDVRCHQQAGLDPRLTHALAAKRMMVNPNETDKPGAKGLATLLLNGSLPEVWAPGAEIRDLRGLIRSRLAMRRMGTSLKNRIGAAFARYGLPKNWSGVRREHAARTRCISRSRKGVRRGR
jgi:hypothetical protein